MRRRTFLTGGPAALAAAGLTACDGGSPSAGPPAQRPSTTPVPSPRTSPSSTGPAPATDWPALARDLDGTLVRPGDADWTPARLLYNTRFDTLRPAAVAYVAHADDVRTVLAYARAHHVPVAIRNGGHSYGGYSSGDGRLIVDVSALNRITVSGGEAVIGAGGKLIDVYRALAAKGVTIPAGSCPTVGVSGLALGGGHGVVSRAYGLTCDSLTGATLIAADGRQLTADASNEPDLFWALRGAGNGNFGVVTELRFTTHPASQLVTGLLVWPWATAAAVVTAWQEWGPHQPDELWSALHLERTSAGAAPTVGVSVCSLGGYGDVQNAVDRLADRVGAPASGVHLRRHGYEEAMAAYAGCSSTAVARCHLPGSVPGRSPAGTLRRETYAARSDFFDRSLPQAGVRTLVDRIGAVRGGAGSVALTALGGAVNRVAPTATAFVHRRSRMLAQYIVSWPEGADGRTGRSWLASAHGAMRPYASGAAYQNYTDPSLADWRTAYYGDAVGRLAEVKRRYDPQRFFTSPQGL